MIILGREFKGPNVSFDKLLSRELDALVRYYHILFDLPTCNGAQQVALLVEFIIIIKLFLLLFHDLFLTYEVFGDNIFLICLSARDHGGFRKEIAGDRTFKVQRHKKASFVLLLTYHKEVTLKSLHILSVSFWHFRSYLEILYSTHLFFHTGKINLMLCTHFSLLIEEQLLNSLLHCIDLVLVVVMLYVRLLGSSLQ